jgi:hypothetical protein
VTHIYTCECGETFRDRNRAMAFEQWEEHRDDHHWRFLRGHDTFVHTVIASPQVITPEPPWRPWDVGA